MHESHCNSIVAFSRLIDRLHRVSVFRLTWHGRPGGTLRGYLQNSGILAVNSRGVSAINNETLPYMQESVISKKLLYFPQQTVGLLASPVLENRHGNLFSL